MRAAFSLCQKLFPQTWTNIATEVCDERSERLSRRLSDAIAKLTPCTNQLVFSGKQKDGSPAHGLFFFRTHDVLDELLKGACYTSNTFDDQILFRWLAQHDRDNNQPTEPDGLLRTLLEGYVWEWSESSRLRIHCVKCDKPVTNVSRIEASTGFSHIIFAKVLGVNGATRYTRKKVQCI